MNDESTFLQAMQQRPDDTSLRLVFADWLEERGDPRGELIRLLHTLTQAVEVPDRSNLEGRLRSLVTAGVQAVGPFWTNSIGITFAWVPAGTFLMGSPSHEKGREFHRQVHETQHRVVLTRGFCLAVYPTTQAHWHHVMGNAPSEFKGGTLPVESVSWDECQEFLKRLSHSDHRAYRLPTEAEWEYACRAGTTTPFFHGGSISTDMANYDGQGPRKHLQDKGTGVYRGTTTAVDSFPPNAWGLYDMHGNVFEWCSDWSGEYAQGECIDPQGPASGDYRVVRGGSFEEEPRNLRSAYRNGCHPPYRANYIGFRAVMLLS